MNVDMIGLFMTVERNNNGNNNDYYCMHFIDTREAGIEPKTTHLSSFLISIIQILTLVAGGYLRK